MATARLSAQSVRPLIDAYKVDLKSFDDRSYRQLGGRLEPILDTIRWLHDASVWVEIVTLLVPGFNDSEPELRRLVEFISGSGPTSVAALTAFHSDYRMTDVADTTAEMLTRAARLGREAGLHYVYAGDRPGRVGDSRTPRAPHAARS